MSVIIKCPNCDKKLKMQEPTPGKKVRCPGCKEPFVPVATKSGGGPKKTPAPKKRPAPVEDDYLDDDDYGDDDYGDDYEEEQPQPRRAAAAGGNKGKSGKASSSKKKSVSNSKSKAPLFIGVAVLAVALAGGLTYMLWPDGDAATGAGGTGGGMADNAGAGSDPAANNDNAAMMAANSNSNEHGGGGSAAPSNSGGGEHGGGSAAPGSSGGGEHGGGSAASAAMPLASANTPASTPTSSPMGVPGMPMMAAPTLANNYSQSGPVDLNYLPAQSEAVAKIDLVRLMNGPLGQLTQMPQLAPQIQRFEQATGVGLKDVESITIGAGGITDAISRGIEPKPEELPFSIVVRTTVAIDASKIQAMSPNSEMLTEGSMSFVRIPANPPIAIWLADSNTLVFGEESRVKQIGTNPTLPTNIDNELFDGKSPIQVLFSPTNADAVFRHPNAQVPSQVPGADASMAVARSFLATARGAFIGIDLTNDLGFSFSVRCQDSAAAQQMVTQLLAAQEESKAMQANQPPNPMMVPFMNIAKAMEESQKIEATGDICRLSSSAAGGGQQLAGFIPMAMMMIGPAIEQAQTASRRVESKNNLKQIGLAMMNFNSLYQRFPNAASVSPTGEKLLSWRVHLLAFLGHNDLYEQFDLTQPWDSPTNKALIAQMPDVFKSPQASLEPGKTVYQVPVGPGTAFEDWKGRSLQEFTDGTSNTITVVEAAADRAVIWTQPDDFEVDFSNPKSGLGMNAQGVSQAALADGSTRVISGATSDSALKSMFTRNAGD